MMTDRNLTSQGAERKQELLDAAAHLFAEQGYAATRVVDIVERAGVAKGLFYWYFQNKEAVFCELANDMRHRLRRHQRAAIDEDAPALVRLVQGAVASVQFMAEHAHFFSLLEGEGRKLPDVLRRGTEQHVRDVTAVILEGQADGSITVDDPAERLAMAVVGMVSQFSRSHRTGGVDMSLDDLSAFVARVVARILAADEPAARQAVAAIGSPARAPVATG
jgi:AcrR family transcriptional regulator